MPTSQVIVAFVLGVILGLGLFRLSIRFLRSTGVMFMTKTEDELPYSLQLEEEPADLMKKRYVLFRISKRSQ